MTATVMSKSRFICKRNHILSQDELEKGRCYRCEAIDAGIFPPTSNGNQDDWQYCEKHKKWYRQEFGCPKCFAIKWGKLWSKMQKMVSPRRATLQRPEGFPELDLVHIPSARQVKEPMTVFAWIVLAIFLILVLGSISAVAWGIYLLVEHWPFG